MSQIRTWGWTNPATAVVRYENVGFTVNEITVTNITDGEQYYWNSEMDDASFIRVDTGAYTNTNGFTPIAAARPNAEISGFTNANPGVLTVNSTSIFGIAAGDTIKVTGIADDGTATTLNGTYVVASVTETTITTATNTAAYSVYVSDGFVSRVTDTDGDPVPTEFFGIQGVTLGSSVVGGNDDVMVAVAHGSNSVV